MQPVSTKESSTWFYDLPATRSSYVQSTRYSRDSTAVITLNSRKNGNNYGLFCVLESSNSVQKMPRLLQTGIFGRRSSQWWAGRNFFSFFRRSRVNAAEN